jgi:hypothetical protein
LTICIGTTTMPGVVGFDDTSARDAITC